MKATGVLVVGSLTVDLTSFSERLPRAGETVIGHGFTLVPGGKGGNQAVASARAGARTWMVGCVGDDAFRDVVLRGLEADGIDASRVRTTPGPTGIAHIRVDASGSNDIVVVPLANDAVTTRDVDAAIHALRGEASVLLLQLEVPTEITQHAAAVARREGMTVILDPAPAIPLPVSVWANVNIVTPNESEAEAITGVSVTDLGSAEAAARWFLDHGVEHAVVTLAGRGALSLDAQGATRLTAHEVVALDSTAAGDAFAGTLGAALALGADVAQALRRGMAAGALAVTKAGATTSLPTAAEVDELLAD